MIDETFLSQTSKVISTINNNRRNIPQANLKSYNHNYQQETKHSSVKPQKL